MTFIAQTEADRVQLPPAIAAQIRKSGWLEVRVAPAEDNESLTVFPLPHPAAPDSGHTTQVDIDDGLSIGEELRRQVSFSGQSVMVRFEGDVLKIYLRQVFKTLGFRPS